MPSAEVMTAGREALKYFFNESVHNGNSTLRKTTINMFNAVVIESPIGESTLGVVTGNDEVYEGCPNPGGDPDTYCIVDLKPIIMSTSARIIQKVILITTQLLLALEAEV